MLLAIGLAFVAGLITAISPCVLPVLPIVLAGGASGGRRRPYAIVAGLVTCFLVSVLFAVWILDQLGLPQDLLRNISIGLLFVIAATLIVPQFGAMIERPLARLARGPSSDLGGGFLLGCALGFVFVPCGGPAIAFVTSSAASLDFGFKTVAVAVAYTIGVAVVLLAVAIGGRRASGRLKAGVERFHVLFGVVVAAAALALVFNLDTRFQKWLPNWTHFLQQQTEASPAGQGAYQRGTNVAERQAGCPQEADAERPEGLRRGARLPRHPAVAEHAGWTASDVDSPARQGRAGRLLDVLLHQLPADAAVSRDVVPHVRQRRVRDRRRAHAGVRLRARRVEREGGDEGVRRPLSGRDRQQLRHLEQLRQPVLAGRVPDRRSWTCPRGPLRRGRVLEDRGRDPLAARGTRRRASEGCAPRRPHARLRRHPRVLPRLGPARSLRRLPAQAGAHGEVHPPVRARPEPARLRRRLERRAATRRRRPRTRCSRSTSSPAGCTSSWAGRAPWTCS